MVGVKVPITIAASCAAVSGASGQQESNSLGVNRAGQDDIITTWTSTIYGTLYIQQEHGSLTTFTFVTDEATFMPIVDSDYTVSRGPIRTETFTGTTNVASLPESITLIPINTSTWTTASTSSQPESMSLVPTDTATSTDESFNSIETVTLPVSTVTTTTVGASNLATVSNAPVVSTTETEIITVVESTQITSTTTSTITLGPSDTTAPSGSPGQATETITVFESTQTTRTADAPDTCPPCTCALTGASNTTGMATVTSSVPSGSNSSFTPRHSVVTISGSSGQGGLMDMRVVGAIIAGSLVYLGLS